MRKEEEALSAGKKFSYQLLEMLIGKFDFIKNRTAYGS